MSEPSFDDLVQSCEDVCEYLRKMRRRDSNSFFDSAEEKLYKGLENALNTYYRAKVTEPRQVIRLEREATEHRRRILELENLTERYERELNK
jgi:uncharacterized protein YeeX (DUF496 family)